MMQQKSIEIIQDAMKKIMDSDAENILREVNTDTFILKLNTELMMADPVFAASMGITPGEKGGPNIADQLTPEELAAQEAERERLLQESMQAEVINSVMRRIEGNLSKYDERMKESIQTIQLDLESRFTS